MWLFVHRPFEIWTWLAAMRIERVYMSCIIVLWLLGGCGQRSMGNIFTAGVFAFTAALTAATMFSPFTNVLANVVFQDWLKYMVFYAIAMTSIKNEKDLKILVSGFIVACFLFIAHSYWEYLHGAVVYIVGASRLIGVGVTFSEYNDYGTLIVCMLPLILPMVTLCKKPWHYLFVWGYVLLTLRSVQLTGSRTGFIMLVAALFLPVLCSKHRFSMLAVVLVAAPIGWAVMPESLQNRYRTIWDPSINEMAEANKRGRITGFYDGMTNWSNFPIFGVGVAQHGTATGGGFEAHNLPGQVAGETGTVGVAAWFFMFTCFGINHFAAWKHYQYLQSKNLGKEGLYCWRVSLAVMFGIFLSLLQGLGLHNGYRFQWVWYGAFQALAVSLLQEKADAARQGKLLPNGDKLLRKKT
jgi:hypothetical protein